MSFGYSNVKMELFRHYIVFFCYIGPLTLTENGITKLYGVASFIGIKDVGEKCLKSNAVYGRVSEPATLKWIRSNIKSFF